jgi:hypothetical protein
MVNGEQLEILLSNLQRSKFNHRNTVSDDKNWETRIKPGLQGFAVKISELWIFHIRWLARSLAIAKPSLRNSRGKRRVWFKRTRPDKHSIALSATRINDNKLEWIIFYLMFEKCCWGSFWWVKYSSQFLYNVLSLCCLINKTESESESHADGEIRPTLKKICWRDGRDPWKLVITGCVISTVTFKIA